MKDSSLGVSKRCRAFSEQGGSRTRVIMGSLFVNNIIFRNAVFYEDRFAKIHVLYARVTYKRTRRSWKAHIKAGESSIHLFYSLKASEMCTIFTGGERSSKTLDTIAKPGERSLSVLFFFNLTHASRFNSFPDYSTVTLFGKEFNSLIARAL